MILQMACLHRIIVVDDEWLELDVPVRYPSLGVAAEVHPQLPSTGPAIERPQALPTSSPPSADRCWLFC